MYEVGYTVDDTSDKILIYRGVNNDFTFKLPAGNDENDNKGKNSVFIVTFLNMWTSSQESRPL